MIISAIRSKDGTLRLKSDAPINDYERALMTDFGHLLGYEWEFTLLDWVKLIQSNYKGAKTDALIEKVTEEYGAIPRVV